MLRLQKLVLNPFQKAQYTSFLGLKSHLQAPIKSLHENITG